jgi:GR25 family glycosyltransferase involved in LPS biosynthesis
MKWVVVVLLLILVLVLKTVFNTPDKEYDDSYLIEKYNQFKSRFRKSINGLPIDNVDMVYCIVAPSRKKYIENQFVRFNTQVTYFDAIFPDNLTKEDYQSLAHGKMKRKKTKLPVQLSFAMCMLHALENDYKTIMIFEDDITINVSKDVLSSSVAEFVKSPFEAFYMGYCWMSCKQAFDKNKYQYIVDVPNKQLKCHHAIVLKQDIMKKLINYIFPMKVAKDEAFKNFYKENDTNVCIPKFSYFDQDRTQHGSLNENIAPFHNTCDLTD